MHHASLSKETKHKYYTIFRDSSSHLHRVVASIAFGMYFCCINFVYKDVPDIQLVVIYGVQDAAA